MNLPQTLGAPLQPPAPSLARPLDAALAAALAALGFFLPFSTAGVSLSLAALALLALPTAPALWRSAPWRDPVMATGLLLLAYIALHTLLTSGLTPAAGQAINRYHELLMAPVLFALLRLVSARRAFFRGLACGAVAYAAAHWLAALSLPLPIDLASRRISAGFGLALCAFVFLDQARASARPWLLRSAAAFLALTVLFAIDGRTGHVLVLVLTAVAAWQHSPPRWRWGAVIAVPLALAALSLGSTAVQSRLGETLGRSDSPEGTLTSTGIRVELLRNGLALARQHAAFGAGFARYQEIHEQAAQARYGADPARRHLLQDSWVHAPNPHNEYLMQLVGGGVVALALFVAWLLLPVLRGGPMRGALVGVSLAFAVGCLLNSSLMDFTEGHLYVALLTWLLAQAAEPSLRAASAAT